MGRTAEMTQTYLDMPETGDETPERPWAIKVSLAMSAVWILFSLGAWTWANRQQVDYSDLDLDQIIGKNGFGYLGLYFGGMLAFGIASLWLAMLGARAVRQNAWVAVVAGAMAMFLVMVPVVFLVTHEISHWCVGCAAGGD
jgi:hypothetical protein